MLFLTKKLICNIHYIFCYKKKSEATCRNKSETSDIPRMYIQNYLCIQCINSIILCNILILLT